MPSILLNTFLWSQFYILNWLSSKQILDTEETWESYENKASPWSFKKVQLAALIGISMSQIQLTVFFMLVIQVEL